LQLENPEYVIPDEFIRQPKIAGCDEIPKIQDISIYAFLLMKCYPFETLFFTFKCVCIFVETTP
jgi:hypothetical protein